MMCALRPLFLSGTRVSTTPKTPIPSFSTRNSALFPGHFSSVSTSMHTEQQVNKFHFPLLSSNGNNHHGGWNNNNNNNNNNNPFNPWWWHEGNDSPGSFYLLLLFLSSLFYFFCHFQLATALARTTSQDEDDYDAVWEVKGNKWTRLIPDYSKDAFVIASANASATSLSSLLSVSSLWFQCKNLLMKLMLPEGFPNSVTSDYLNYSLWRGVQGVASQISGVLATQVLVYQRQLSCLEHSLNT